MANNKEKTVSVALIVSSLCMLMMIMLVWIGLLLEQKNVIVCTGITLAVAIFGSLACFWGVKAKKATMDYGKWIPIEILCVLVMVGVGAFSVREMMYSFNYLSHKSEYRAAAQADIHGLESLVAVYVTNENLRVDATVRGLNNYVNSGRAACSPELSDYITQVLACQPGELQLSLISNHEQDLRNQIQTVRVGEHVYGNTIQTIMNKMIRVSSEVIPAHLTQLVDSLEHNAHAIGTQLTAVSSALNAPVISAGTDAMYTLEPSCGTNYTFTPTELRKSVDGITVFSWGSFFSALAIAIGSFFFYIFNLHAPRKAIDKQNKNYDKLGLPI